MPSSDPRWKRSLQLIVRRLMHRMTVRSTPHQMALGVAVGLFVAFQPFPLVGVPLAIGLAWILGGNRLVVLPMLLVTNPLTAVPVYMLSYWLGCWILGEAILPIPWEVLFGDLSLWERGVVVYRVGHLFVWPVVLGSLVIGVVLAAGSYGLVRLTLEWRGS